MFATLSETTTGVGHDVEAFGKIVAKTDALLVVDGDQRPRGDGVPDRRLEHRRDA